jgi:chemotaxis protein methyltransferase CheR
VNKELTTESLLKLSDHLAQHMGINFSTDRLNDLSQKMTALAEAFAFDDLNEFAEWLLSDRLDREQIELLADFLTVGETYFFRDPKAFAVLEEEILPLLIEARQKTRFLRIWSAACCTGEEPYSIAMLLKKMIPDVENWQIKILATDINQTFLERATEGSYGEWSFRATPEFFRDRYFKPKKDGKLQIDSEIKKMVRFEWMNLAELRLMADPSYSCMDIIFCRNVLIYFSVEHGRQIVASLNQCLSPDGYLFVSPNELPIANDPSFQTLHRPGAIILQRSIDGAKVGAIVEAQNEFSEPLSANMDQGSSAEPIPSLEEAQTCYDQGSYKEAAELLLSRCQNGGDFPSLVLLAKSFANHSDLKNALRWCDQAIKANRLNAATHYLRATILQEQGATFEATHALRQALLMNPNFVLAQFNLGILLRQTGRLKEANRHFKAALKLLGNYQDTDVLPESEGTTASGMRVIVSSLMTDSGH